MSGHRTYTKLYPCILPPEEAHLLYEYLRTNIQWQEGVRSKLKGFTRFAKPLMIGDDERVDEAIGRVLSLLPEDYVVEYLYLNYYPNGQAFTPNHSHPGTVQLVLSLGATRTLTVNKKPYALHNGDAIIFGSSVHGVPPETSVQEGRISIATFMKRRADIKRPVTSERPTTKLLEVPCGGSFVSITELVRMLNGL